MKSRVAVVQIKSGMPTVAEARRRLALELESGRRRGLRLLKLVHGYGSTGVGGKLRGALRRTLAEQQAAGRVGRILPGEQWTIFDEQARGLLESYPELRTDADLERGNAGITLVELR
ncbi:MAG TPA: hypothetical protein VF832_04605 [Longimicrobiales bacterium]